MTTTAGSATPERLRPLWLTETYPPSRGGMAESCDRLVRGLRAAGVSVDLGHFLRRPGAAAVTERQEGGRLWGWPVDDDPAHALNLAFEQVAAEAAAPTHVVAFGGYLPMLAGPLYAAWLGVPLVTLIRGNDFDANVFTPRRRDVLHQALSRSALVVSVASDKARRIAALYPELTVRTIANGIELDRWDALPSDRTRADALRVPGRRTIGLFGQLKRKKGALFLLDALRRSGRADAFHVLLAGWLDPELEAWLGEAGLSIDVRPFADRYDLVHLYLACDVVAIPSFYDGMPNVMVEAAALGVPLLASRVGGMADWLTDDEDGLLFAPGDRAAAGWALERAASLGDADLRAVGEAGRELVRTRLTAERETAEYVEALSAVLTPTAA